MSERAVEATGGGLVTLALFSLGEPAVAQGTPRNEGKIKTPPRRQAMALADRTLVPEPR